MNEENNKEVTVSSVTVIYFFFLVFSPDQKFSRVGRKPYKSKYILDWINKTQMSR
jgi:hypothetical protein